MNRLIALMLTAVAAAAIALAAGVHLGSARAAGPNTVTVITTPAYAFQDSNGTAPADLTVPAGSTVTFVNPSGGGFHDVDFDSIVPSACSGSSSVGSTTAASGPWQGTCTFNTAGTYTFHCSIHLFAGQIVVTGAGGGGGGGTGASGATGTTGSGGAGGAGSGGGTGTVTTSTSGSTTPTGGSGTPAGPGQTPPGVTHTGGGRPVLAGLSAPARLRGSSVSATVTLGRGGSTLRASLVLGDSRTLGSLTRRNAGPGVVRFRVALTSAGRRLLGARGSLVLRLVVTVTPPGGTRLTRSRRVILRG